MKNILKAVVVSSILLLGLTSCISAPGVVLPEQARSLNEIRHAIYQICGGKVREISSNQREILAPYFSRKADDPSFNPTTSKERLTAHFWILGDRRPYDIHVQVLVEKKIDGAYEETGEDEKLSQKLADQLAESLNKSLDKRNLIDDVRPF